MIPVGSGQKPLLEYIIRLLRRHGIRDLCLLVGYKAEQIHNYFNEGSRFGVKLTYVYDRRGFSGNGGAVLNAYKRGIICDDDETLLIYYGDILSNINLSEMLKQHYESGAMATVAIVKGYQVPVGVADLRNGRVERLVEKPILDIFVGIGILALKGNALKSLEQLHQQGREMDLMRDLLPRLIESGELVHAYVTEAFWYDVGSTERYEKLNEDAIEEHLGYLFTP
jgi:mannose-1-phosphate guanylyltransferase